jgi:hypothetical protein
MFSAEGAALILACGNAAGLNRESRQALKARVTLPIQRVATIAERC